MVDGGHGDAHAFENRGYDHVTTDQSALSGSGDTGGKSVSSNGACVSDVALHEKARDHNGVMYVPSSQDLLEAPEEDVTCKWGPLRPACCGPVTNVKAALIVLCCAAAVQGMVVNGFVNVSITSVEKRFDIESKDAGLAASMYDIASVICLIPVGYFGGQGSKPRWLGLGVLLLSLGSLIFAMPHFLTGLYDYEVAGEDDYCDVTKGLPDCGLGKKETYLWRYKYMLYLGQFLNGAGAAPLYTLGVTYIDENLKPKMSSLYLGIFYAMSIVGPAVGYALGGYFLTFYTDFHTVPESEVRIDADSEAWVGAWWLGPLIGAFLALCVAIPLLGFPRRLPGYRELEKHKLREAYAGRTDEGHLTGTITSIKHFPSALKSLITNPTFMFLNLAGGMEGIVLSGLSTFLPKYLEAQFSLTASSAALYMGAITVPAGGLGMFLGGYVVKRFQLKIPASIRFCVILNVLITVLGLAFIIRCPEVDFAGVNVRYDGEAMKEKSSEATLRDSCNRNCSCSMVNFRPVCGGNDVMYFNPCAAGCLVVENEAETKFENCTCVMEESVLKHSGATAGKCDSACVWLPLFIPLMLFVIFFTFCTDMPALSATLRCVPPKQRSFAVSIQWIFIRCLGSIPGPIIFGAVIDETCLFWKTAACDGTHNDRGACYFYGNSNLSTYLFILSICCKVLSTIFFTLSMCLYKAPPDTENTVVISTGAGDSSDTLAKNSTPDISTRTDSAKQDTMFDKGAGDNGNFEIERF